MDGRPLILDFQAPLSTPAPGPLQALRILVVDDDGSAREVLKFVLEAAGACVSTASSGEEALQQMDRVRPEALLVDIGMPIVNGFALVEEIRRRPAAEGGRVPIAALTGYLSAVDRARAFQSGFQAYLVKPVEPDQLISTLSALCFGEEATDSLQATRA
jgi:CheY-like chemotaxis protein